MAIASICSTGSTDVKNAVERDVSSTAIDVSERDLHLEALFEESVIRNWARNSGFSLPIRRAANCSQTG